jgi:hypothetical protein
VVVFVYIKEFRMKNLIIGLIIVVIVFVAPVSVVLYAKANPVGEQFVVSKVIRVADWLDQYDAPAWELVESTDGNTILRIHGGSDGYVWFYPNNTSCPLNLVLKQFDVKITKILCCHPKQVKERSNLDGVTFFASEHAGHVSAANRLNVGEVVTVCLK